MKWDWQKYGTRCVFAAVAGLLLAAAFAPAGIASLAWLAPGLTLWAATGFGGRRAFAIGFAAGLGFWLASIYWICLIPVTGAPIAGWLALSAYCALYTGAWVWLCETARQRWAGRRAEMAFDAPEKAAPSRWPSCAGLVWPLFCAATWVGLEFIRSRFLTGFPWSMLGVSQYQMLPLIQVAEWTGVFGVSFLVVWCSMALLAAVWGLLGRPTERNAWVAPMALPMLVLAAVIGWGTNRALKSSPSNPVARTLKVALIQPSIPQTLIWDGGENTNRFQSLLRLSERALATQPQVLIWPEAAVPDGDEAFERGVRQAVSDLAREHHVWVILGVNDYQWRDPVHTDRGYDTFNASILVDPEGRFGGKYYKQRLVIFGEYVPLARWLPFLKWFTPIGEGFATGKGPVPFRLREPHATASVLICFEDNFPQLAREAVDPDTDFLVNLTNNGWFRESAAQWQHAANAVFRAVENRIPLVRCTNNGLTCWVDAAGRLRDIFKTETGSVYGEGFEVVTLPLLDEGGTREFTYYRRHGDVFAWVCVAVLGWAWLRMSPGCCFGWLKNQLARRA